MATETARIKSSFEVSSPGLLPPSQSQRSLFMAQIILRILAIAFTVTAVSVTLTSSQNVLLFGIPFEASYSTTSAFKFFLAANAIVCGFSVLSLIFVCLQRRSSGSHPENNFFLLLHDMVMMVLMISGCAAATAVGYVSRYGEAAVGWLAVCNLVSKFCNKGLISVVLSYLAFFCYLALNSMSAYKLTTRTSQ